VDPNKQFSEKFIGQEYIQDFSRSLPIQTLLHIQDMRQAGYTDSKIMHSLKIPLIPPESVLASLVAPCSNCGILGYSALGYISKSAFFAKCFEIGHVASACLVGWRCRSCHQLGHIAWACSSKQAKVWRVKGRLLD
jgi:hypothetical protein